MILRTFNVAHFFFERRIQNGTPVKVTLYSIIEGPRVYQIPNGLLIGGLISKCFTDRVLDR
jgi:hypothetical protein